MARSKRRLGRRPEDIGRLVPEATFIAPPAPTALGVPGGDGGVLGGGSLGGGARRGRRKGKGKGRRAITGAAVTGNRGGGRGRGPAPAPSPTPTAVGPGVGRAQGIVPIGGRQGVVTVPLVHHHHHRATRR